MKRIWLLGICCLLLTGCGKAYWVEDCGEYRVALRDSPDTSELWELVLLRGKEETVVETLDTPPERVDVRVFTDLLGYSGFRLTQRQGLALENPAEDWSLRTYYAVEEDAVFRIARSFGWGEPQDYGADLDGDGREELVSNVTYGGDGHQDAYVYQRRRDGVWVGQISTENLPDLDDRGANSTAVTYDPDRGMFVIRYLAKNQEDPAVVESRGLERVTFTPYEK